MSASHSLLLGMVFWAQFVGVALRAAETKVAENAVERAGETVSSDPESSILDLESLGFKVLTTNFSSPRVLTLPTKLPLQRPPGCYEKGIFPCALKTQDQRRWQIRVGENQIHLGENTLIILQQDPRLPIELVQGQAWVESPGDLAIRTPFAQVEGESAEFWVSQKRGVPKTLVRALNGMVYVQPVGFEGRLWVPVAMENWFGAADKTGKGTSGAPLPINLAECLYEWAKVFPEGGLKFKNKVQELLARRGETIAQGVKIHEDLARRYIASEKLKDAQEKQRRERLLSEQKAMRRLFRQRNYLETSDFP